MKAKMLVLAAVIVGIIACNANANNETKKVVLKTELDSVSYAIGQSIGLNLKNDKLDEMNLDAFLSGIRNSFGSDKDTLINREKAGELINAYLMKQQNKAGSANLEEGNKFLEANKSKEGVKVTASGLQYKVIKEGDGAKPLATNRVKVHYHGTFIDGKVFDSSVERGQPAEFPLDRVIPGWTEGLQLMSVGSKYIFYIPANLAYGPNGPGEIGPNRTLVFEVELLDILK